MINALPVQEDPWNSISAGALTGGFLQLRTGLRSAAKSAAFGGVLLVGSLHAPMHCHESITQMISAYTSQLPGHLLCSSACMHVSLLRPCQAFAAPFAFASEQPAGQALRESRQSMLQQP